MPSRDSTVSGILAASDFTINSARESLQNIRRASENSYYELNEDRSEKTWSYSYLQDQFKLKNLEDMFSKYTSRINQAYFSLFLILLPILSVIHFSLVFVFNLLNASLSTVIFDLACYVLIFLTSLVTLYCNERRIKEQKTLIIVSCLIFALIFLVNFSVPLYHFLSNTSNDLRPAYTSVLIIACYLFLNLDRGWVAAILGFFVSLCEIFYLIFFIYNIIEEFQVDSAGIWRKIISDLLFLGCINMLGIYYRRINEIVERRTFLDRRACVMSTLKLKYEEEQEEQLMLSIIPKNIIEEVKVDILETIESIERSSKLPRQKPFENPYIHTYDNVSILYADVVNFTSLTSTLKPVTKLVETLNDLFGSFDDASEKFNVLRIKFLGDCYYCVSGLPPNPAPNHAEACVDLGLAMIQIIKNVRESSGVNIDMRIGVNSGQILSGLIGLTKWQYDVWSKDVLIANKMESTGEAGKVHITKQTKDLLQKPYNIIPTERGKTRPELKPFNLETYLLSPIENVIQRDSLRKLSVIFDEKEEANDFREFWEKSKINKSSSYNQLPNYNRSYNRTPSVLSNMTDSSSEDPYSSIYFKRESVIKGDAPVLRRASGLTSSIPPRIPIAMSERRSTAGDTKRRTAFMNSYIKKYNEHLSYTEVSLKNAIEKMPLSKYEQWFKVKDIHPFFLVFRNLNIECQFLKQEDPLFIFALSVQILLIIFCTIIQNLTLSKWQWNLVLNYITLAILIIIIAPLLCTRYLWKEHMIDPDPDLDPELGTSKPQSKIVRFVFRLSENVTNNWILRFLIYFVTVSLGVACVLKELVDCNEYFKSSELKTNFIEVFSTFTDYSNQCVTPWNMTRAMSIAVVIIFLYVKIYVWLKLVLVCFFISYFSYSVYVEGYDFFKDSDTTNYMVPANLSHIMVIFFLGLTLHLMDRQSDYLNRLDYNWNMKLTDEKKKADIKHKINNMLLKNILPIHVAELYLDVSRPTDELFHEEYDNVAVMFATVVDFEFGGTAERTVLEIMNRLIGDFDKLLITGNGQFVEKIKVINWTYMAACGLDPGRKDSIMSNLSYNRKQKDHVVVTLVKFAVEMMKVLKKVASETFQPQVKLRIGISHGEVAAGVVGSKKPLYDIWGDAVNMASRMDSNGEPGKIQVPESTAEVIVEEGYYCEFRDNIFVKGKGNKVPTYFVPLDENDQLIVLNKNLDTRL